MGIHSNLDQYKPLSNQQLAIQNQQLIGGTLRSMEPSLKACEICVSVSYCEKLAISLFGEHFSQLDLHQSEQESGILINGTMSRHQAAQYPPSLTHSPIFLVCLCSMNLVILAMPLPKPSLNTAVLTDLSSLTPVFMSLLNLYP